MLPLFPILCLTSSFSFGLTLVPRARVDPPPAPYPPGHPPPPIGPYNYPIPDRNLIIRVAESWGDLEKLPFESIVSCLADAQENLDAQRTAQGDAQMMLRWEFQQHGIKLNLRRWNEQAHLTEAITFLKGIAGLMTEYRTFATSAAGFNLYQSGYMGLLVARIEIRRGYDLVVGSPRLVLNGTIPFTGALTNLTTIDPTNYRVPGTPVTVSLLGNPPYGSPLAKHPLILFLANAQVAVAQRIDQKGDIVVESLWRFENGPFGLDVHTQLSVDCKYSVLGIALSGVSDLLTKTGGVGPVAAGFSISVDGLGEVAVGQLRLLGGNGNFDPTGTNMANATLVAQDTTATVTLVNGALDTRLATIA